VALCENGEPTIGRDTTIGQFRLKVPSINVHTVGAGGGSIAHVPELTKALRVGPQSAGAEPGPAAYGKGGTEPTVTDANVVVGHLPPRLLGGEMTLDVEGSTKAVAKIGEAIGLDTEAAAEGMLAIVNENMAGALRLVSVQRGYDPRDFALVAFGGAGPLHANAVAELMGSFPVIVPPSPGLLCAIGDLVAEFRNEFAQTIVTPIEDVKPEDVASVLEDLGTRTRDWMTSEGIDESGQRITYLADMRYVLQGYEISVPVNMDDVKAGKLDGLGATFDAMHEQLYGFKMDDAKQEIVNLRCIGNGAVPTMNFPSATPSANDGSNAIVEDHEVVFQGKRIPTKIYDRAKMTPGAKFDGPAIVTEFDSTTVVLPGYVAEMDEFYNILINPKA
jgi:N-methylhydantoinase A